MEQIINLLTYYKELFTCITIFVVLAAIAIMFYIYIKYITYANQKEDTTPLQAQDHYIESIDKYYFRRIQEINQEIKSLQEFESQAISKFLHIEGDFEELEKKIKKNKKGVK